MTNSRAAMGVSRSYIGGEKSGHENESLVDSSGSYLHLFRIRSSLSDPCRNVHRSHSHPPALLRCLVFAALVGLLHCVVASGCLEPLRTFTHWAITPAHYLRNSCRGSIVPFLA